MPTQPDVMSFRRQVCDRLRTARKKAEMSMRHAAALLGVSHAAVGHWETGTNPVDLDTILRMASLYNTTVVALVADRLSDEDLLELARRQLSEARKPE